jgi:hypothetical protein
MMTRMTTAMPPQVGPFICDLPVQVSSFLIYSSYQANPLAKTKGHTMTRNDPNANQATTRANAADVARGYTTPKPFRRSELQDLNAELWAMATEVFAN